MIGVIKEEIILKYLTYNLSYMELNEEVKIIYYIRLEKICLSLFHSG